MKKITLLLILLAGMISAVGCNTIKGMGRDVERVGEEVEDVVD